MTNQIQIKSTGAVGALVSNVDLTDVHDQQMQVLEQAFAEHGVLFFREQNLSPEAHLAFASRWGEINVNRFFAHVEGYPQIAEVAKEPDQQFNIGGNWHTDHSYDQIPALGSMLLAHEVPAVGGDTLFASCSKAYESLSQGMKKTLSTLRAVHSSRHVFGNQTEYSGALNGRIGNGADATQDAVHPVVVKHPLSGRPTLYVNAAFTLRFEGWTDIESKPLLDFLYAHIGRPEHSYRFQWDKGSMAFWDNRATWHWAINDYHGHRRLMHRVTIEGEALTPL
jgi:taurine dioxygenase